MVLKKKKGGKYIVKYILLPSNIKYVAPKNYRTTYALSLTPFWYYIKKWEKNS